MIRLERLKDSTRESGVVGEKVGKLIWGKMKKLECHAKDFEHALVVMGCQKRSSSRRVPSDLCFQRGFG